MGGRGSTGAFAGAGFLVLWPVDLLAVFGAISLGFATATEQEAFVFLGRFAADLALGGLRVAGFRGHGCETRAGVKEVSIHAKQMFRMV